MTNWAGAVETLGKGLFAVGMKVTQREDDEIAFMRQKALQELGIQAQKDLQKNQQEFLGKQAVEAREHEQTMLTTKAGLDVALQERGWAHDERMTSAQQAFQTGLAARRERFETEVRKLDSVDSIIRATQSAVSDIDKTINDWQLEYKKLVADSGGQVDPAVAEDWQGKINSLLEQRQRLQDSGAIAVRELTGGKPLQPGPTKEAAAAKAAAAPAAAPTAPTGPPAGAYTGPGSRAPAATTADQPNSSVFDSLFAPSPGGVAGINQRIGQKVGGAAGDLFLNPSSPTGQINRDIYNRIFGN